MKRINYAGVCGLLLLSAHSYADVPITITATVLEPSCTVTDNHGNAQMAVTFPSVDITALDTPAAPQMLSLKVSCDSAAPSGKTLKMRMATTTYPVLTAVGAHVLSTSMTGLGIALYQGNGVDVAKAVPLNQWVGVDGIDTTSSTPTGVFTMTAALVKAPGKTLAAGVFSSASSLLMNYQ